MNIYAISALINAITSLSLGLFVFLKNKRNLINYTFALLSFSVFLWSVFYFLWQNSNDYAAALLYTRLLSIGSILVPIFYLHWVFAFLEIKDKNNNIILSLGYIATAIFLLFSSTNLFVKDVEKILIFDYWPKAGPVYTIYLLVSYMGLVGYGTFNLFKSYFSSTGLKRYQIKYIIIGTIIGFFGGASNFFLWYDIRVLPLGNIILSLYVFILFYAMIRYRLMDIRVVARKIFIYFTIAAFTYGIFYFLIWMYNFAFGGLFTTASYFIGVFVAPVFVALFYSLDRWVKNFSNKYLFVSLYNYQETINNLIDELFTHIDLNKIINLIIDTIKKTMQLDKASVFLIDKKGNYQPFKVDNSNDSPLSKNQFLIKYISKNQKILVKDELYFLSKNVASELEKDVFFKLYEYVDKMKASLCLPLIVNKKLIGIIVLGSKISGDPYTKEDLELLNILSKQASIVIENAIQYKEIQQFKEILQKRVDEQTRDIREKNEELERLLAARSEFLSIASHQLRTPLAAVRGYASMLKGGDYGELNKDAQKSIEYIYESSVRMIELVNNLLSVNRLERGIVNLNIKDISINEIIEECIKDLEYVAENKGIKIEYLKIDLPIIKGDYEKIKNSISNIISNGVLYTIKGKVQIKTSLDSEEWINIEVKDSGIGINKEELSKMFKSFSRGKGGTELYTQGTGLGLYIAKSFIEMHGGKISVYSEGKNKGSIFTIQIPTKSNVENFI
ncbi:MAG TPA: ATP-binding protein [Candidatus Pacearchaeota archaeon]|nr:ATP-binding protein [Candidatus Pacearchaeota archaeon]